MIKIYLLFLILAIMNVFVLSMKDRDCNLITSPTLCRFTDGCYWYSANMQCRWSRDAINI